MRSRKNSLMSVGLRHLRSLVVLWAQDIKPSPRDIMYFIYFICIQHLQYEI